MGRRLVLVLAFALIVGLSLPAFAEVNNIKVSGDITAYGISRTYFYNRVPGTSGTTVNKPDSEESHAASIIRLRIDADLTENVGATLRLINERDWNRDDTADTDNEEIQLDLAYVTLKEFLYSPLTLTLGRQEMHFGNDFIIGDPDRNNNAGQSVLTDEDLSMKKAFDAVRGTLNYDPLVIDLLWAKVDEDTVLGIDTTNEKDDIDLFGVNSRYNIGGNWNAIGELYYFGKVDQSQSVGDGLTFSAQTDKKEVINNIGTRVELNPLERLILHGEVAYQFGKNNEYASGSTVNRLKDHKAWAAQTVARYALDMKYNPVLMGIYSYYSGDVDSTDNNSRGWDPMYENQTNGHIANILLDPSNLHVFDLSATINPIEDLSLKIENIWYRFVEKYANTNSIQLFAPDHRTGSVVTATGDKYVGSELDVELKYDYTEDVQLGLLGGMFFPGDAFRSEDTDTIRELIASVKVSF